MLSNTPRGQPFACEAKTVREVPNRSPATSSSLSVGRPCGDAWLCSCLPTTCVYSVPILTHAPLDPTATPRSGTTKTTKVGPIILLQHFLSATQLTNEQDRTIWLWEQIAARYKGNPWVAGYNPLNEPCDPEHVRLPAFYKRFEAAIRKVDPDHILWLDGNTFAMEWKGFEDCILPNCVYALHDYSVRLKTHPLPGTVQAPQDTTAPRLPTHTTTPR